MVKYEEAIKYVGSIFILRQKMPRRHLLPGGMFVLLQCEYFITLYSHFQASVARNQEVLTLWVVKKRPKTNGHGSCHCRALVLTSAVQHSWMRNGSSLLFTMLKVHHRKCNQKYFNQILCNPLPFKRSIPMPKYPNAAHYWALHAVN